MEVSRKITAATLSAGHNLRKLEKLTFLGRIAGFAKSHDVVTTQYGEADRLIGEFVSTRSDGKQALASACFLPASVGSQVVAALKKKDAQGVKFGFDIYAAPNAKSATGYEWKIKPLMEVKASAGMLEFTQEFPEIEAVATPAPAAPEAGKKAAK